LHRIPEFIAQSVPKINNYFFKIKKKPNRGEKKMKKNQKHYIKKQAFDSGLYFPFRA